MISPCDCKNYNGGQCYNCLNGQHSICEQKGGCKKISLPKNTMIGKKKTNAIMVGDLVIDGGSEQIFLECKYPNRKNCHDTIALFPKNIEGLSVIENLSDNEAGRIFADMGWLIKGYNSVFTRCPNCRKKLKRLTKEEKL